MFYYNKYMALAFSIYFMNLNIISPWFDINVEVIKIIFVYF